MLPPVGFFMHVHVTLFGVVDQSICVQLTMFNAAASENGKVRSFCLVQEMWILLRCFGMLGWVMGRRATRKGGPPDLREKNTRTNYR